MGSEPTFLLTGAILYTFFTYVVFRAERTLANVLFSLFTLSTALWILGATIFVGSTSAHGFRSAFLIEYISYIIAPLSFYIFTKIFIHNTPITSRSLYIFPAFSGLILLTLYVFFGIPDVSPGGTEELPRVAFHIALFFYLVCYSALGYRELFKSVPESIGEAQARARLRTAIFLLTLPIFCGMAIGIGAIALRADAWMWVGPFLSLMVIPIFPVILRRYRNLRVRIVTTEILAAFLWALLFSRVVFAQSPSAQLIDGILLLFTTILSMFLVQGISAEEDATIRFKKMIKELEATNNRLKTFDQQKSSFVAITSHQLRTPVTAIRGYISMALEQSFGDLNRAIEQPLERIRAASEKLGHIVEDLLEASRIEHGLKEFSFCPADLEVLVKRVSEPFRHRFSQKHIGFSVVREGNFRFVTRIDEEKMALVLRNILEHAYATTVRGQVEVILARNDATKKIRIAVSDSGAGVDQATLETFFRIDSARHPRRAKKNRWLWLYLADRIIEAHRGTFWIESGGNNSGATFFIEIPILDSGELPPPL
ncbi:MAG: sensor histidine kinase [Minisyncoccota bacterium]